MARPTRAVRVGRTLAGRSALSPPGRFLPPAAPGRSSAPSPGEGLGRSSGGVPSYTSSAATTFSVPQMSAATTSP
jgi:hypothetical protein